MSGVAVQGAVDSGVRRAHVVRLVLAVLLLGGWATWAVSTYQSQLRVVRADTFHEDLAAGDIIAFRAATNVRHDSSWLPDGSPDVVDLPATNEDGTIESPEGMTTDPPATVVYWTDAAVGAVRAVDVNDSRSPSADVLIQELRQAGVRPAGMANALPGDQADPWGLLTALFALVLVVRGPLPTRGTRWFWFWMLGVTWGLGVVAYAVLELLRPRPVSVVVEGAGPHPEPEVDRRIRGGRGFLIGLVLSAVISVAGSELSRAVGGVWVPLP